MARGFRADNRQLAGLCLALAAAGPAAAAVEVALVPEQSPLLAGDPVRLRLVLTADSPAAESFASVRIILDWNSSQLRLVGIDDAGSADLLTSGFPDDPFGINEATIPQDGTALYVAFAPLGAPIAVDQEGVLLTTLVFESIPPAAAAVVDIPATGGLPATTTTVFDGEVPNLSVTGVLTGASVPVYAEPTRLLLDLPDHGLRAGDAVTARLSMENLNGQEAASYAAFLGFDPAELAFVEGTYTAAPFGSPVISPIASIGETLDLAAQLAPGAAPTSADAVLATIVFQAVQDGCVSSLRFRDATPGTRLMDAAGAPIGPLTLVDPVAPDPAACACPCEMDGSSGIDVFDLLGYLDLWFAADPAAERTGQAAAVIDVLDLLAYLDCWFAPPAGCL